MKKINIVETENEKFKEINKKVFFKKGLDLLYIVLIIFLIGIFIFIIFISKFFKEFRNLINENINQRIKLISEVEYFKNQSRNLYNEANKFNTYKYINEYNLYRMICPKEVIGKKKF